VTIKEVPRIILHGDLEEANLRVREGIRQLNILKNLMGFQRLDQDVRRVRYTDGSEITCRSIFGIDDVQIYVPKRIREREAKVERYVYVTISCYVTVWDLQTGEVADIPGITFPCHRDKLKDWLKEFKEVPTRQWLKDNPKNNRDYLEDNKVDIGNENRVELASKLDPSYDWYFGVKEPYSFDNTVQDVHIDTDPIYPYSYPRKIYDLLEKDTPSLSCIANCSSEECNKSFAASIEETYCYPPDGYYMSIRRNNVKYIEPHQSRSKKLYLGSYPSSVYLQPGFPSKWIEYSIPESSPYPHPVIMKSSIASFSCIDIYGPEDWELSHTLRKGYTASFSTVLGDLIVNYIPKRELSGESESLRDMLRQGFDFEGDCFGIFLREGVCHTLLKFEARRELWEDVGSPLHSTDNCGWCLNEALDIQDLVESESNRFGVSWCGSPFNYRISPETQTKGWYRVLLRFYMGGFHTSGYSNISVAVGELFCPDEDECSAHPKWHCNLTSWSNKLKERFSSVQATIELEKPEEYPKRIDRTRYERPVDYDSDPDGTGFCIDKKYSSLCAFPGRTKGYDEKDNKCFPFDGTYVLHTLGKAVEELINNYYKDGSDDQLIVYLLKREIKR